MSKVLSTISVNDNPWSRILSEKMSPTCTRTSRPIQQAELNTLSYPSTFRHLTTVMKYTSSIPSSSRTRNYFHLDSLLPNHPRPRPFPPHFHDTLIIFRKTKPKETTTTTRKRSKVILLLLLSLNAPTLTFRHSSRRRHSESFFIFVNQYIFLFFY